MTKFITEAFLRRIFKDIRISVGRVEMYQRPVGHVSVEDWVVDLEMDELDVESILKIHTEIAATCFTLRYKIVVATNSQGNLLMEFKAQL